MRGQQLGEIWHAADHWQRYSAGWRKSTWVDLIRLRKERLYCSRHCGFLALTHRKLRPCAREHGSQANIFPPCHELWQTTPNRPNPGKIRHARGIPKIFLRKMGEEEAKEDKAASRGEKCGRTQSLHVLARVLDGARTRWRYDVA